MASPGGLEPTTPRFVVWYSIQLSYGETHSNAIAERQPCYYSLLGNAKQGLILELPAGFGPTVRELQSLALPLGYGSTHVILYSDAKK